LFSRVMRVGLLTGLRPERRARVLSRPIFSGPVNRHRSVQRGKLPESFRYFLPAFEPFCWEQARRGRDRQRNISFCRRLLLCSYGCCERVAGNFGRQSSTGRFIQRRPASSSGSSQGLGRQGQTEGVLRPTVRPAALLHSQPRGNAGCRCGRSAVHQSSRVGSSRPGSPAPARPRSA